MAASPRLVQLGGEWLARPAARGRVSIVVPKAAEIPFATAEHGDALLGLGEALRRHFHRRYDVLTATGGWWILAAVDVENRAGEVVRPDLVGWRRDRVSERPCGSPIGVRPDWACHVRGADDPGAASELRALEGDAVPHYWQVDPERGTLTAHQWSEDGYRVTLRADRWQLIRAEPFDAVEIRAGSLFGEIEDDAR